MAKTTDRNLNRTLRKITTIGNFKTQLMVCEKRVKMPCSWQQKQLGGTCSKTELVMRGLD